MTDQTPRIMRRRRRPPRSCDECRRRKIKCNRQMPCNHCTATRKHCVFSNAASRPTLNYGNETSSGRPIGPQVTPQQPSEPVPAVTDSSGNSAVLARENMRWDPPQELNEPSRQDDRINELESRLRTLEEHLLSRSIPKQSVDTSAAAGLGQSGYASNPVLHGAKPILNKSRLFGRTHWTNDVPEFKRISEYMNIEKNEATDNERVKSLKSEIHVLLQKCKLLAKAIKASRPTRCLPVIEPQLPERYLADTMARLYISRFESVFRILHIPSFWIEYQSYWRDPANVDGATKFKIQLVIALGCSIDHESHSPEQVQSAACQWVYAAQAWLSAPLEKNRIGISGIQIQCLLILARQCLSISGDLIWVAMGTLVRTAMQMGLHLDPSHFDDLSVSDAELRRRLWATIMELNVQASLDAGMPPIVSIQDFDTKPPSNIDDTDMDDSIQKISPKPHTVVTETSLQIFLSDCLRPRLDILRMMNGLDPGMSQDEVVALTSEISNHCNKSRGFVKKNVETGSDVFRHNLADLLIRRFLLSLHRPWACTAHTGPLFYYSRKISYDTAATLLSPPQDDNFTRLLLRGSGIFKNRIIHVSLALASELLIEIQDKGSNPVTQQPWDYRSMLVAAVQEARQQSAQRMQFGETNVKLHMKLGVVLIRAESLLPGQSLQEKMIQSAKDSLQTSYATIQANMGLPVSPLYDGETFNMGDFSPLLDFDDILNAADLALDEATASSSSMF